ncbi:MAG: hypothetical protein MZV64_48570 [Ignavibacteriales bacterium]|nr:hypothetical protein [Ignavibacteriales bacterium]
MVSFFQVVSADAGWWPASTLRWSNDLQSRCSHPMKTEAFLYDEVVPRAQRSACARMRSRRCSGLRQRRARAAGPPAGSPDDCAAAGER